MEKKKSTKFNRSFIKNEKMSAEKVCQKNNNPRLTRPNISLIVENIAKLGNENIFFK